MTTSTTDRPSLGVREPGLVGNRLLWNTHALVVVMVCPYAPMARAVARRAWKRKGVMSKAESGLDGGGDDDGDGDGDDGCSEYT